MAKKQTVTSRDAAIRQAQALVRRQLKGKPSLVKDLLDARKREGQLR